MNEAAKREEKGGNAAEIVICFPGDLMIRDRQKGPALIRMDENEAASYTPLSTPRQPTEFGDPHKNSVEEVEQIEGGGGEGGGGGGGEGGGEEGHYGSTTKDKLHIASC
uniref:Uncharacterized protein n=1 Tax=Pristionchus pacificus TaxID=54126 RepID=A0A2A6CRK4_PRIPA|eukprot:PDM80835.1 hypothetical protein PRIPAC_35838 [Pristionchus pacificus]